MWGGTLLMPEPIITDQTKSAAPIIIQRGGGSLWTERRLYVLLFWKPQTEPWHPKALWSQPQEYDITQSGKIKGTNRRSIKKQLFTRIPRTLETKPFLEKKVGRHEPI